MVGARSGGIPESVNDGAGILVPPANPDAAAQAIGDLLESDVRREALGKTGRLRVERELNWTRVVRELRLAERAFREYRR